MNLFAAIALAGLASAIADHDAAALPVGAVAGAVAAVSF